MGQEGKQGGGSSGLLTNASRLAGTLLEIIHTRIELLGLEIAEERQRFVRLLILGGLSLVLFIAGLVAVMLLLVFSFWDQRGWLTASLALLFLGGAFGLARSAWQRAGADEHPFKTSVEELAEDVRRLKTVLNDERDR